MSQWTLDPLTTKSQEFIDSLIDIPEAQSSLVYLLISTENSEVFSIRNKLFFIKPSLILEMVIAK